MTNKEKVEMKQKERVLNWLETRTMKRIPLEKLVVADMEPQHRDTEEVQHEILNNGILTPITVCGPYSDGTYRVIDGKRRIVAFQKLFKDGLIVRRHITGGENRTLISVKSPLRLCRTGTSRRLSAV